MKHRLTARFASFPILLLCLASAAGCQQQSAASPDPDFSPSASQVGSASVALNDSNVDRAGLPPLKLPEALPPAPVPATFDVADLSAKVTPAVVNITTTQKVSLPEGHPFDFFFGPEGGAPRGERQGAGTGFIIDSQGYVVTNEHVVRDADEVLVKLWDERELAADVVGRDPKLDLALLKIKSGGEMPAVRLGASGSLRIGEHVLAVGNPFGLGHTATLGIVSAKSRFIGATSYDDFIQTDAAINPGNSGGPLFNWRGEVVGIATAIRPGANNIGFAIPVDALKDVLPQLREKGHVVRGKLGLVFQPMSAELAKALKLPGPKGALIAQIESGGSAARAGLKAGDVIIAVNGKDILHAEELPRNVARNPPGAQIAVSFLRDGKRQETKATLDTLEDDATAKGPQMRSPKAAPANNKLGVQVSNVKGGGVRVEAISPASPLKEVRPGDIVLEVDGKAIKDVDALEALLGGAKSGAVLLAKIKRGDSIRFAPVPVPGK